MGKMPRFRSFFPGLVFAAIILVAAHLEGQSTACRAVAPHTLSPAEKAYSDGSYAQAEQLYTQALAQKASDPILAARLVETLLRQDKLGDAAKQLSAAMAANPNSAAVLTAQAEVLLRQGQPWLAAKSLDAAAAAAPCYARVHLVRSRIFRIDSMYASERSELQKAYDLDATDPDILMAWSRIMPAAQEIEGTARALAGTNDLDPQTRAKAANTIGSMMPLLFEDSQTCKGVPAISSVTLPLLPSKEDGKHIDGFQIEVKFPKGPARLQLDTAASGLYISRALADLNGFQRALEAPVGTVQAETVQIGSLEFHDCMVGVSESPFPGKVDGYIGTDILASYLVTIDGPAQKLKLDPMPPQPGVLPGDRLNSEELAGYEPVYHRRQYLLVPVTLDNKARKLFALDTGMRLSAMDSETAHSVSAIKVNFTNPLTTKSGSPAQVYRDNFDFQFAGLSVNQKGGSILAFEPAAIDHNTGFDVAGMLGFDMLGQLVMHLDYRDGLVKFEVPGAPASASKNKGTEAKAAPGREEKQECPTFDSADIPLNETMELKVTGTLDSAHLKPGKEIYAQVVHGLIYPGCTLERNSIVYGHITAVSSTRNPDSAELGLIFDHGDCNGQPKKPLSLHLIALLPPPDEVPATLHGSVPTEVSGGTRQISETVADTTAYDALLSSGSKPHTVHPGVVVGMPKLKLDPLGGTGCSARITSAGRSLQLGTGAELILTLSVPGPSNAMP
jgi:tetratricopeptide (TPR) repeat protein